jgi:ferredoxin
MPKITLDNGPSFEVAAGSDWQHVVACHPSLPIKFGCRQGNCGSCRIMIVEGQENLTKIGPQERETLKLRHLPEGCRLACQCAINGDVVIKGIA